MAKASKDSSLLVTATAQSVMLGAVSCILAQGIAASQEQKPFSLDMSSIAFFTIWALVSCPPNVLWQIYLEEKYPAHSADHNGIEKFEKANTLKKFLLDQTISAVANTAGYIAAVAAYKGHDTFGIVEELREEFWPLMQSGWKVWPLAAIVSFCVIPLEHRTLFGSIVNLFWNVFLSLRAVA